MPPLRPSLASPELTSALLRLPPALRTSFYQTTNRLSRRPFSATSERKSNWTDLAIAGPTALLDSIHACGIPWYATIPITAILVRGIIGFYVHSLPARKSQIIRCQLYTLSSARGNQVQAGRQFIRRNMLAPKVPRMPMEFAMIGATLADAFTHLRASHRTGKEFGAPVITLRSFFNFGMMITFTEALRAKCGMGGLLSLLAGYPQAVQDATDKAAKIYGGMSPEEVFAHRLETARAARQAKEESGPEHTSGKTALEQDDMTVGHPSISNSSPDVHQSGSFADAQLVPLEPTAYSEYIDQTLQSGGLGWIQDLTLPDPTFFLPCALFALLVSNALLRPTIPVNTSRAATSALQLLQSNRITGTVASTSNNPQVVSKLGIGQRLSLTFAWLFALVSINLPSAMLLYIVSTMATGFVQRLWLDYTRPLPDIIIPCRRSPRQKAVSIL